MSSVKLYQGDCLEVMPTLEAESVDAILTDLPYGTTACSWDTVIPFEPMWKEVKRVLKPRGVFVTTASQPFTSALVMSNVEWFKWEDIWHKSQATGHLNAKVMPMREHENLLVFGDGRITFNPQIQKKAPENVRPIGRRAASACYGEYKEYAERSIPQDMSYPRSVFRVNNTNHGERGLHPTQKPVALYEYLTLTYTNPGDTVLDMCAGSGTTGIACVKTGRNFIGIEKREDYFEIMSKRIREAQQQLVMELVQFR